MRSGKTMKEDSTTVGVGERARTKPRGEPEGVDVGDSVGELLCEDMLALVPAGQWARNIKTGALVELRGLSSL